MSGPVRTVARSLKAAEYRSRAELEAAAAIACNLDRVREGHERAAAVWMSMALASERRDASFAAIELSRETLARAALA